MEKNGSRTARICCRWIAEVNWCHSGKSQWVTAQKGHRENLCLLSWLEVSGAHQPISSADLLVDFSFPVFKCNAILVSHDTIQYMEDKSWG